MSATMRYLAVLVCSVLTAIVLVGCSPTQQYVAARTVETAAAETVMTGYEAWRKYDHDFQEQLLAASPSMDAYKGNVVVWRTGTRAAVDKAFSTAKDGVIAFGQSLDTAGAVKSKDFGAAVTNVIALVATLTSTLQRYGIDLTKYGLKVPALLGGK